MKKIRYTSVGDATSQIIVRDFVGQHTERVVIEEPNTLLLFQLSPAQVRALHGQLDEKIREYAPSVKEGLIEVLS